MLSQSIHRFCILATLALMLLSSANAQVPSEKRLPPGVLAFFSVPSVRDLGMQMKDTSFGRMFNDPAFDDFKQQFKDKFNEGLAEFEQKAGFPASDLEALLEGESAFAAVRPIGQSLSLVWMHHIGDHKDIFDQLVTKIHEELADEGVEPESGEIDGVAITKYTVPFPGDRSGKTMTIGWFLKDETFVIASSTAVLESVLERWDGQHRMTFADAPTYQAIMERCTKDDAEPSAKFYYEPVQLSLAAMSMSPDMAMASAMASAYVPVLGLNKLKGVGGATYYATEKFDMVSRSMCYMDLPATGVMKIFECPTELTGPPAWVPAESFTYYGLKWNVNGAYEAIENMYDSFMGQPGGFEQMVNNAAARADGLSLNPKKDVIDVLTGEIHFYMLPGLEEAPDQPRGMVSIGVNDEAKAKKLLTALIENGDYETETIRDVEIYTGGNLENGTLNPALAVSNGNILVGSSPDQLKAAIEGTGKALKDSPEFQKSAAEIPEKQAMLSYASAGEGWKQYYEAARSGQYDAVTEGEIDFSTLPPFEVVQKYLTPYISYAVGEEGGAYFEQFGLRK